VRQTCICLEFSSNVVDIGKRDTMSDKDLKSGDDEPLARRIDAACNEFEKDWRSGAAKPLEEYARNATGEERVELLERLQSLERSLAINSTVFLDKEDDEETEPLAPLLANRYELRRRLGQGGFGEVWLAMDTVLKREVAIKILRPSRSFKEETACDFLKEGERLAKLSHPGIVSVFDVAIDGDAHLIVSEYIRGKTLRDAMRDREFCQEEACELVAQVAEALHCAHLKGIVHRDVKPANIMVTAEGRPQLVDFGLAVTEEEQLNESANTVGTYPYMSPEEVRGASHLADSRTDIYSLGVVLYELLTRRRPYVASDADQYREQILNRDPRPLRTINDSISREVEAVCLRALEKSPSKRYTTARDFADDLRRALTGSSAPARAGHEPAIPAWMVGLVLLLVGGVAWILVRDYWGEKREAPEPAGMLADQSPTPAGFMVDEEGAGIESAEGGDGEDIETGSVELHPPTAADREVAEWVLSIGGRMGINNQETEHGLIGPGDSLPREPFSLTFIRISRNPAVVDEDLARLRKLKSLNRLNLAGTRVTDAGMQHLAKVPGLHSLWLNFTEISDAGVAQLSGQTRLEHLNLRQTEVTDECLEVIRNFRDLRFLDLSLTEITDAALPKVAELKSLQRLQLDETAVTDAGLVHLQNFVDLQELSLKATAVTPEAVQSLRTRLPPGCVIVTD
jgi:hypothetical protein